jgi:hypothetical protein
MIGGAIPRRRLEEVADVLEARFEEILSVYEGRLSKMQSALIAETATREQLRAHARAVLEDVVNDLHSGGELPGARRNANYLPEDIGTSRARSACTRASPCGP